MSLSYTKLPPDEIESFLDAIHQDLNVSTPNTNFEKGIKYLVFLINSDSSSHQLLHRMYDTIIILLQRKPYLINLVLDNHLMQTIGVSTESRYLFEVLIINQLKTLVSLYEQRVSAHSDTVKEFLTSLIHTCLSITHDLKFKNLVRQTLQGLLVTMIDGLYHNLGFINSSQVYQTIQLLLILNNFEILEKLMFNSFSFDMILKKAWVILSTTSFPINDHLKSLLMLNLINNVNLSDNPELNKIRLLCEWLVSCFNGLSGNKVLEISICQYLLMLLKISIKFNISSNVQRFLNLEYYTSTNDANELPPTLKLVLDVIKSHRPGKPVPNIPHSDLESIVNEINDLDRFEVLDFFRYKSNMNLAEDLDDRDKLYDWLHSVITLIKTNNVEVNTATIALGHIPCLTSGDFDLETGECQACGSYPTSDNPFEHISYKRPKIGDDDVNHEYYKEIILETIKSPLLESPVFYCVFLINVYKLLASYRCASNDLSQNPLFMFIKSSMIHNNRTIRLLTCRILPLFLIDEEDENLELKFSCIYQFLTNIPLDHPNTIQLAESTIKGLTEVSLVSEGEWLNALILKLIDLLGGSNEHHTNLVSSSFHYIARAKGIKPYKLLSPFLPLIASNLVKSSTVLGKILDASGMTKKYFFNLTKEYTTPHLLEYYQYDYIQDIADSCGLSKEKLIGKCLPRIIAVYLARAQKISDKNLLTILKNAGYRKNVDTSDLYINSGVGLITWNVLLQINYDRNGEIINLHAIYKALEHLARVENLTSGTKRTNAQSRDQLSSIEKLLEIHCLQIVQKIALCIHQMTTPFYEKILAVRSIEFLIKHNIHATASVLSQVCTSLQAMIELKEFEYIAANCLLLLVKGLNINNLISLFDIVISLIFQKFDSLQSRSKIVAVDIIHTLFQHIGSLENNYVLYFFSIPFIPNLISNNTMSADFKNFKSMSKPRSKVAFFPEFTRRLKTMNKFVVRQALRDLRNFTVQYQDIIQQELTRDLQGSMSTGESVSELINTLLDTSYKFKNDLDGEHIATDCAKCLSIIGSVDFNKFKLKLIKPKNTLIFDFDDYTENSVFLKDFLENIIIVNFWASNNPITQMHYSFAMQEFLKVLRLNDKDLILNPNNVGSLESASPSEVKYLKIWNNFSDVAKSTLIPFFKSGFVFSSKAKNQGLDYPIFKPHMPYDDWLNTLTMDLIANTPRSKGTLKSVLFGAFSALITQNDLSISNYLLKYLVLSNVLNENERMYTNLMNEFDEIFLLDTSRLGSSDSVESLKAMYQTIFEVFDYLHQWKAATIEVLNDESSKLSTNDREALSKKLKRVKLFIRETVSMPLYEKSAFCGAYERSILYLEEGYRKGDIQEESIIENLDKSTSLHSMYSNINDLDALDGVLKNFPPRDTGLQLKSFQYNENWSLAQEAFHVLSENKEDKDEYQIKFLKSLNDHAAYDEVLSKLSSGLDEVKLSKVPLDLSIAGLHASMFSGDINQLKKWFYISECIGAPHDVDDFITFKLAETFNNVSDKFEEHCNELYKVIGTSINASNIGTSRNLELMTQLHMIYDLKLLLSDDDKKGTVALRLENIDQSFETKWKVLSMHKFINILRQNNFDINQNYLRCSKLARESNKYHIAIANVMRSMNFNDGNTEIELETNFEYSQILWSQGKQTDAIKTLETINVEDMSNNKQKAKIQLQYADWLNESNHRSSKTIIDQYTRAYSLEKSWEKPYFALGKYYDKLLESQDTAGNGFYQQQIIKCFLMALTLGSTHIFEALPKLITIWLDFAQQNRLSREGEKSLGRIIKDIEGYIQSVPNFVWYTALTQILSRIGHIHLPSVKLLQDIASRTIISYPKQAIWFVLSHTNSKDRIRKERVEKVLDTVDRHSSMDNSLLKDAHNIFKYLINICEKKFKKGTRKVSMTKDLNITALFEPFKLVIPVRSNLDIKLPAFLLAKKEGAVFPKSSLVTFNGVDDQVNIFHSLQMPKQITVRGSDGRAYRLMIKKDDTRKDAKVVEFTTLINRLLTLKNESRKRNLIISNYAVTPLAQNMGVIEFVSDVMTMKSIVQGERKKRGDTVNDRIIFGKLDKAQKICKSATGTDNSEPKAKLLQTFEGILNQCPPVLHKWFISQFSDPTSWYLARNSYTRSTAVMSIVGYIIGLGDRHCENILFYKTTGSILHIDFDCLFEKGVTLPTPEIVPFRLTNNIVDAMGINKIEGTFRKTCEVTDAILRDNEHSLMNNLETLIYDPLLDWENQQNPQQHLKKVRRKLIGLLDEKEGLPMNIHGQIDILIQIASSNENLSQMYGGWSPHI